MQFDYSFLKKYTSLRPITGEDRAQVDYYESRFMMRTEPVYDPETDAVVEHAVLTGRGHQEVSKQRIRESRLLSFVDSLRFYPRV